MSIPARLCLMLLAGLALAGCATNSAQIKSKPVAVASAREERLESSRDHWFWRDIEDRSERMFESR